MGLARPRLRSRVSSRSFCIACGSTEPNSTGRRRLLPSKGECRVPANGGKRRPCRDDGDGEFDRFFASGRKATAIATLKRQRPLHPPRGGSAPTAERTVGPARMIVGELDTQTRNLENNICQ